MRSQQEVRFSPFSAVVVGFPSGELRNTITNDGPLITASSFPSLTNSSQRIACKIILATLSFEPEQMLTLKEKEQLWATRGWLGLGTDFWGYHWWLSFTPCYSNLLLFIIMSPYFFFFAYEYLLPSPLSHQWLSQASFRSKSPHWRWLTMKIMSSEEWGEILLTKHFVCPGKPSFWWSEIFLAIKI